jgi:hypothetical protein
LLPAVRKLIYPSGGELSVAVRMTGAWGRNARNYGHQKAQRDTKMNRNTKQLAEKLMAERFLPSKIENPEGR